MSEFTSRDYEYMAAAISLAKKPVFSPHPNPRVGCVIVKDEKTVGSGFHEFAGGPHAEINALKEAGEMARQSTVYVTLEPCSHYGRTPPCANALIDADVSEVVIAMQDPNPEVTGSGIEKLKAAGIQVRSGLLEAQAKALNKGFIKRMLHGMPWVSSKIAMSLDGRTAMSSGESQWITGPEARKDVQLLRAKTHAILTGSGTVQADDPRLTVRDVDLLDNCEDIRQPIRVVVDSANKISADANIFKQPGTTILVTESSVGGLPDTAEILSLPNKSEKICLDELMKKLAKQNINEILVEAGPGLNGALLDQGLIDELIVYVAPDIMGDDANGMFHLPLLKEMKDKITLECMDVTKVGRDIRMQLQPKGKKE